MKVLVERLGGFSHLFMHNSKNNVTRLSVQAESLEKDSA